MLLAALAVIIVQSSARPFHLFYEPGPEPQPVDSPTVADDSAHRLRFPITDRTGNPAQDNHANGFDLHDPANLEHGVDYDPSDGHYYLTEKVGDEFVRNPAYLTFDEYQKYSATQDEQKYWKQRLDALTLFNKQPTMPVMYKQGIFDRIFGSPTIQVKPQGNVDVTFGINSQNIKNPTLVQRAQKYSIFDFDMQMNINLLATIGDKLKLNISNNTKATFDYQNVQKLEYTGKEDEILKKLELGQISFPLKTTLIQGVQSLFGIKTQLQFGKLWVTAAVSQQKSKRQSITIQGGAQTQTFGIKADDYEENKHYLLAQYFHDRYNTALKDYPVINSQVTINKIEVWVTNRTGAVDGVRDVLCFQDLGEAAPYSTMLSPAPAYKYPDNRSNTLYNQLQQLSPAIRQTGNATTEAEKIFGMNRLGIDFARTTARKLTANEYTFNPQLGYISLNTQVNPDDVLGVAYQYTVNGQVYKVGEFAEDLPPDTINQKVLFLKLLKNTAPQPQLPVWKLMMKNVYALGGLGVSKEDFRLNVLYQDPGGGEKRYIPEENVPNPRTPLIQLLNLDRLNFQNDPQPDGVFDYVEGITILPQTGKVIFPLLEPFGRDLIPALGGNAQLQRKYLYNILYDSTKTVARQFQQNNRFIMRGSYKSSSSSEIFLGGFNIPQGSVTVSAGGQKLAENTDYTIDYGLGRLKILNSGILSSGIPINVSYEDNATFGFQQQNFMGARFDYYANDKLTVGGTVMRLTERPFTQKTTFGEDPIRNTQLGVDGAYQSEVPGLTRLLDKLPIYSTTASSFITASGEVAGLLPGHPKAINALDPEGSVYIDDFEGTRSSYDLKFPSSAWSLASVPVDAKDRSGQVLFPEATLENDLRSGQNRARLAWYSLEPSLVDPTGGVPDFVKKDTDNLHYIRLVQQTDVYPQKSYATLQNALSTFDLTFFPKLRGPYNFDATNVDLATGHLLNPRQRWGGIMRALDYSDFEQSNVEYVEFWVLDPFIGNKRQQSLANGGSLYINLGNVSEDVLKDGRKFFENGIQNPKNPQQLDKTKLGYVPRFQQQITRAFDNDPAARAVQDVGYDGADDNEEANVFFNQFLADLSNRLGANSPAYLAAAADAASDNYHYYRGTDYDNQNLNVLARYKYYNNPQGNSPVPDATAAFSSAATTVPESEDIDRDNTLNETENYYQYRVDLRPGGLNVGSNYIVSSQTSKVTLPDGSKDDETWYQFKVPIRDFTSKVGNIADFRSIRFMRMFLTGFDDSVTLRFAQLNLGRNQWRRYNFSLLNPGENIPDDEQRSTDFTVTSVSVEENSKRTPIPYVIPPGVSRQLSSVANGQTIQQNEQSLDLQVCTLKDGDARAAYKEVNVDMRQFDRMRMFIHGEPYVGANATPLKDGDVRAFIRIGSDFINNYYEYQIPLHVTQQGSSDEHVIWPDANLLDIALDDLVHVKTNRNNNGGAAYIPYEERDSKGNIIRVVGNPNVGESKTIMLGILNPKKVAGDPNDDGLGKCAEVWFDELRMTGLNEKASYAATGKVNVQLADLGSAHVGGSMHTQGYGNIDQKLNQRSLDNFTQWDANTNLSLGKLMPRSWGVQLPLFVGHSQSASNPQYNPYDLDVKYKEQLDAATSAAQRDSLKKVAQDYTSITSVNLSNVKVLGSPDKQGTGKTMPWSVKNFGLSYSYNRQFKRNPLIEGDELTQHRLGLDYSYSFAGKSIEPFKKLIKSRNKWYGLIKDFNFKLLPSNFTFRTELNKIMDETKVRNVENDGYQIPPTYYKNFTWLRTYALRWELTRSLSFDYTASNNSRVDEPYGRADTKEKRDTLWDNIKSFGRNTLYTQSFNASYALPFAKVPLLDWVTLRLSYGSTYNWTAASLLAKTLGNTINNTQSKSATGEANFTQLYNKSRFLRAATGPRSRPGAKPGSLPGRSQGGDMDPRRKPTGKAGDRNGGNQTETGPPVIDNAGNDATAKAAPDAKGGKDKGRPATLNLYGVPISTANMSDHQLDSLTTLIRKDEEIQKKALALKKKADRRNARRLRKSKPPELNTLERTAGRLITSLKRGTLAYSEQGSTLLPGYLDSTKVIGINPSSGGAPGLGFAFGDQPANYYLDKLAREGKLSRDSLFNAQFNQTYSQNLNVTATLEPIPNDLRIDLTLTKTFSKSHNELFKDTTAAGTGNFLHLNPYETGAYNISYISLKTLFQGGGSNGEAYKNFLSYRQVVSNRLGIVNPYTHGVRDPLDTGYAKGYNRFSQDALIPAFIAAYSGRSANNIPLIDNENKNIRSNPFHSYLPLPNWRISYNGLSRLPLFKDIFNSFTVNDAYTANLTLSSYVSSLYYQDEFALGHPSFIDSVSGNYVPYFQVPNISITEAFGPLIGVDAALKNNLTARFEFRKSRQVALSLIDYQVSETRSQELIIGGGYRIRGLRLPFSVFGIKKLDNDLNIKLDIGIRDDKTSNSYLAQNVEVVTRGQRVISISPSIDYIVSDRITLRMFYDRRQSIPYISSSYPITTTKAGITLRFIFAQ